MEPILARISAFISIVGAAAMAAFWLGYVAHNNLGISRQEIRTPALIAAGFIAALLATEYFGKKLRKPK
jgi:hypothetical protein